MRAQGGRYEPVLAPLSLSRSVSTLLESDSASHMDTKACGNFPLGEDHPIEKITRYPIPGGRYAVITWWLCIMVYACLGGLACIVAYACPGGLACLTRQGALNRLLARSCGFGPLRST